MTSGNPGYLNICSKCWFEYFGLPIGSGAFTKTRCCICEEEQVCRDIYIEPGDLQLYREAHADGQELSFEDRDH